MDINALSRSMEQIPDLQTSIGAALMENAMDLAEVQGQAIQELIATLPTPGIGENIDISL